MANTLGDFSCCFNSCREFINFRSFCLFILCFCSRNMVYNWRNTLYGMLDLVFCRISACKSVPNDTCYFWNSFNHFIYCVFYTWIVIKRLISFIFERISNRRCYIRYKIRNRVLFRVLFWYLRHNLWLHWRFSLTCSYFFIYFCAFYAYLTFHTLCLSSFLLSKLFSRCFFLPFLLNFIILQFRLDIKIRRHKLINLIIKLHFALNIKILRKLG